MFVRYYQVNPYLTMKNRSKAQSGHYWIQELICWIGNFLTYQKFIIILKHIQWHYLYQLSCTLNKCENDIKDSVYPILSLTHKMSDKKSFSQTELLRLFGWIYSRKVQISLCPDNPLDSLAQTENYTVNSVFLLLGNATL